MEHIKMIWDFRSPAALKTAQHYEVHLKEFMEMDKIPFLKTGHEVITPNEHAIAYLVVEKEYLIPLRNKLKPHRGAYYKEE
ncbi:hypothetical protein [Galbibacter sp. PAP.153]|uniref:hypothetical protein n=1 Tax=Galbibacter sp. PAP.153 TaxID=3104623 RepID=UPI00300AD124